MAFNRKMIPSIALGVLAVVFLTAGILLSDSSTVTCGDETMTRGDRCIELVDGVSRTLSYTEREEQIKQDNERFQLLMYGAAGLCVLVAAGSAIAARRGDRATDEAAAKASDWQGQ